jgi:hypothetical protein
MVKAKELRIGNIVSFYKPLLNDPQQLIVQGIYENEDENQWYVESDVYSPINEAGLLPISLTVEWLKKFGFEPAEESPGDNWYEIQLYRHTLQVCPATYPKLINIVDEHDQAVMFTKTLNCEYVHQLQNLYHSLTGEELQLIK